MPQKPCVFRSIQHHEENVQNFLHFLRLLAILMKIVYYININAETMIGYKFAKPGEGDRDYAIKCDLYGMVIPSLVFTYHWTGPNLVVTGS